jgi:crotonobetainyl-CoA:carnitine CoA-transferase CaiB-like acyl-CoA transferase
MEIVASARPPLTGLKVIELADDVAGEYEGRLLAEMGADVIKIEPPGGSRSRRIGPFVDGRPDPNASLAFWYYNSNKSSVVLDLDAGRDRAAFDALVAAADMLVIGLQPKTLSALGLDLEALSDRHERLIVVSVTPFGLTGPWADYKSSDLVGLALGGPLISCGYDDHAIPPIRPGGDQAYHTAASFAHIGVMLALLERQRSGRGQLVDVAMHDACAVNVELANPYWFYPRVLVHRQTCRHAQPSPTQSALFRTADDRYVYFTLILSDGKLWQAFVKWMDEKGMAAQLLEPEFAKLAYRQEHFHEIQELAECFFQVMDAETAYREGQAAGLPIGVLNAPEDLFHDEHLKARNFFVEVEHEGRGSVLYPSANYRFSAFAETPRTAAPKLGEQTLDVLAGLASARLGGEAAE